MEIYFHTQVTETCLSCVIHCSEHQVSIFSYKLHYHYEVMKMLI